MRRTVSRYSTSHDKRHSKANIAPLLTEPKVPKHRRSLTAVLFIMVALLSCTCYMVLVPLLKAYGLHVPW
jgi:hypothetical protein